MQKYNVKKICFLVTFVVILCIVFIFYQRSRIFVKNNGIIQIEVGETYSQDAIDYLSLHFYLPFEKENISKDTELYFDNLQYIDEEEKIVDIGEYKGVLSYKENKYDITLIVTDTTSPTIEVENEIPYNQKDFQISDYIKVFDNSQKECQVEVDDSHLDIHKIGEYTITVTAKDESENELKKEFSIKVMDKSGPVITNINDVSLKIGDQFDEMEGVKAIDEVEGDCSQSLHVEGSVNTNKKGLYELTYTAKDSSGNITSEKRQVTVNEATSRIKNVPMIKQLPDYYNGCESASSTMLLQYYGYDVSMTQMVKSVPTIPLETYNGRLYGANPNEAFTGSMSKEGYGVFVKPMMNVMQKKINQQNGKHVVKNITGSSIDDLLKYIDQGIPVQVWATELMKDVNRSSRKTWYIKTLEGTYTDDKYTFIIDEHCLVLIGYTQNTVIMNDPLRGIVEYDLSLFRSAYEGMGKQALIMTK